MNTLSVEDFREMGQEVLTQVPYYDLSQHQPEEALESGIGNCAAKAIILASLVEVRFDVLAVMAWNREKHGKIEPEAGPMGIKEKVQIKHIDVVVPTTPEDARQPEDDNLYGVAYGMRVPHKDGGRAVETAFQFGSFNEYSHFATVDGEEIHATYEANELGYDVLPWREAARHYLEALGESVPDFESIVSRVANQFKTPEVSDPKRPAALF